MGHGIQWLLALPWTLTMYGYQFYDQPGALRPFNMFVTVIGPLFLLFLPAMLFYARKDKLMRYLLAYCAVGTVAWFVLSAQTNRYIMPILPALALVSAGVLVEFGKTCPRLSRIASTAIGIELVWGLATWIWLFGGQIPVAIGAETHDEYLSQALNIYPICRDINSTLPENSKLMLMDDTRGFYIDRDYMWGIGNHNLITPQEVAKPETLDAAFHRLGITHLLFAPSIRHAVESGQGDREKSLRALISQGKLQQILVDKGFAVYALEEK
jgi:hypothetical protein